MTYLSRTISALILLAVLTGCDRPQPWYDEVPLYPESRLAVYPDTDCSSDMVIYDQMYEFRLVDAIPISFGVPVVGWRSYALRPTVQFKDVQAFFEDQLKQQSFVFSRVSDNWIPTESSFLMPEEHPRWMSFTRAVEDGSEAGRLDVAVVAYSKIPVPVVMRDEAVRYENSIYTIIFASGPDVDGIRDRQEVPGDSLRLPRLPSNGTVRTGYNALCE